MRKKIIIAVVVIILLVLGWFAFVSVDTRVSEALPGVFQSSAVSLPAFPGCEGFGCSTPGGRGGQVIEVTNLNDSGPGSLRAAIEAEGPRIVAFRVSGTIELLSSLIINNPFITIAGQSAPGGGIALKNAPSNGRATLDIRTHDVIVRYIRVRPGPSATPSGVVDALNMPGASNVVIDHSSFSWATDENINTWLDAHDITIQWSIIAEGLHNSTHSEGPHSMGMLLGSAGSGNISVHHNLFAHNNDRNPRIVTGLGVVDVVNNVIFNFGAASTISDRHVVGVEKTRVNYVSNYFTEGPDARWRRFVIDGAGRPEIFVRGNISPNRSSLDQNELDGVVRDTFQQFVIGERHAAPAITETSAFEAYEQVLAGAGATLPVRDAVDARIVDGVGNGEGRIIDDPAEVGGWPELGAGVPPPDRDADGMPDEWEVLYGLNPYDPLDSSEDVDVDGYTNIEEYLNQTIPGPQFQRPELVLESNPVILTIELPLRLESGQINSAVIVETDGNYQLRLEVE